MADRVHPMPPPPSSSPPPPPPGHDQPADDEAAAAPTETTPLHPSFSRPPAPPPGTYIIQVPKDQVLRVPPPDRDRRYKKLAARPARCLLLHRACCLACACASLLLLLLLAAAFVGAVYLIFRPRAPAFSVASLSIRGLDDPAAPSSALSPELVAAVRADNDRNKKVGVDYRGGGEVAVSYSGVRLAAGQWPAFYQAPRNVTVFSTSLSGKGVSLTEEQRRQLVTEQAAGAVPLMVEAMVPVRIRFGKVLRSWTVDVKAGCEVTVDKLAGTAAAANRGCKVKVKPLWWWW